MSSAHEPDAPPPRKKRFTFKSYNQSLKSVHLPSPTVNTAFDDDISESQSHFQVTLQSLQQLSLAPSFVSFSDSLRGKSDSLPLLLHNHKSVAESWLESFKAAGEAKDEGEGIKPLLQLLKALVHDLRLTLVQFYLPLLNAILPLLSSGRKLPEGTLTEVLDTTLSLFKYIFVPSFTTHPKLLRETWKRVERVLRDVKLGEEVVRMVGEVWGAVIRRVKPTERETMLTLMFESIAKPETLESVRNGLAWSFVSACQAPSRTLHPSTAHTITSLLNLCLALPSPSDSAANSSSFSTEESSESEATAITLLRRFLTSMAHHVAGKDEYVPVMDAVTRLLETTVSSVHSSDTSLMEDVRHATAVDEDKGALVEASSDDKLRRIFSVVEVACGVRGGARITQPHLSRVFDSLNALPILTIKRLEKEYAGLLVATLTASEMGTWMGKSARAVLEKSWEIPSLGLTLTGRLSNLEWPGFMPVMFPLALKNLPSLLTTHNDSTISGLALHLLLTLYESGKLGDRSVTEAWWDSIRVWAEERMSAVITVVDQDAVLNEQQITTTVEILQVSPVLTKTPGPGIQPKSTMSPFVSSLLRLLSALLKTPSSPLSVSPPSPTPNSSDSGPLTSSSTSTIEALSPARTTYQSSPSNLSIILALVLKSLPVAVNAGSVSASQIREEIGTASSLDALMAHWNWSAEVMEGAAELVDILKWDEFFKTTSFSELQQRLSQALLSHDQRLRISALRLLSSALSFDESALQYPSVDRVLAACITAEETPLDVANVRQRTLNIGKVATVLGNHVSNFEDTDDNVDSVMGTPRAILNIGVQWLLAQFKVNIRPLWTPSSQALSSLVSALPTAVQSNVWHIIFEQLQLAPELSRFESPAWIAEREDDEAEAEETERTWRDPKFYRLRKIARTWNRDVESVVRGQLIKMQQPIGRLDTRMYTTQLLTTLSLPSTLPALTSKHSRVFVPYFLALIGAPTPVPKTELTAYLTLFASLPNPKALFQAEKLKAIYRGLLSHPDAAIQLRALECMLSWKSSVLVRFEPRFRLLLDDTKWRDELALIHFGSSSEDDSGSDVGVTPEQRREVVDVFIRLTYGMMIGEKKGRGGKGTDKRGAVLSSMAELGSDELVALVSLMLEPFVSSTPRTDAFEFQGLGDASFTQQSGYLNLLGDVLKYLGPQLVEHWDALLQAVLEILNASQQTIEKAKANSITENDVQQDAEVQDDQEDTLNDSPPDEEDSSHTVKLARSLRQSGLRRLADFFRSPISSFDFSRYMPSSFASFISPRISSLEQENTQAPSALLELFVSWTVHPEHIFNLVRYDSGVLPHLYACLNGVNVKPTVVARVLDVVERILVVSEEHTDVADEVLKPHVSALLQELALMFERITQAKTQLKADHLAQRQITILSSLSSYISDPAQASRLLSLIAPILRKPTRVVPEKVKQNLLEVAQHLMALIPECQDPSSAVYTTTYDLLSSLFQTLRTRNARVGLIGAFEQLTSADPSFASLMKTIGSLNAYSTKRLEEPDFALRMGAFTELNDRLWEQLGEREWLPVIYNMLFYIQDPDELAVRHSAAAVLNRLVDAVGASLKTSETSSEEPAGGLQITFTKIMYPALRNGLRSKVELVRVEILSVIAHAIETCGSLSMLHEMTPLLAGGDAEANFFNNILHIQTHRRTRALRRLSELCDAKQIRSSTLSDLFIPLVSHFVSGENGIDHHVVNEAVVTMGRIAGGLAWSPYNALVQHYLKGAKEKTGAEKIKVRTLVAILDHFHFQLEEEVEDGDNDAETTVATVIPAMTPQNRIKVADAVNLRLLPNLISYMEKRDETEDSLRIPVAVGVIKVAQHLPEATRRPQIEKLVTVLSQALRSKSQETRDLVRETLCRITVMLGVHMLPTIIKELRAALLRGPQLHVLAFVVHALLVHLTSPDHVENFNNLDESVTGIAHVSAEVIFGRSGMDVLSEDFRTKMREVRGSANRGLDTFAITARYISPSKISLLLQPVRAIMEETEAAKVMQRVDDVFRRVASGLNSNSHVTPPQLLVLCHTFINQNAKFLQSDGLSKPSKRKKTDFDVQIKRQVETQDSHYANNSYRFVAFGLDLFVTAFRRGLFDFNDADIISRLNPMVKVVGNALYSDNSNVVGLALRAAAAVVRCPLKSIPHSLPVYVRQIFVIVRQAGSTESDVVQTAFKSLAVIVRECPDAQIPEADLTYLLELITPDLEEKDRQIPVFALLRAIVSRKFVVPEIYDIMDKVAGILVTNQSAQVQELCRGVFLQFLLDYPQGKGRLRTQMSFLAKNLSYVFESGRLSVMEFLSAIISKFELGLVQEYADLFFVALFMVIANDDSSKCREMAAELLKVLFGRLDHKHRSNMMGHLTTWATQHGQTALIRTVAQVYGLVVDVFGASERNLILPILSRLNDILLQSSNTLAALEASEEDDKFEEDSLSNVEWQLPYHTMNSISKILRALPDLTKEPDQIRWDAVTAHTLFPHAWVRLASSRLLGTLFSAYPAGTPDPSLPSNHPLSRNGIVELTRKMCLQLRSPNLDETLSLQLVKNLFYVGKSFSAWPKPQSKAHINVDENEEDTEGAPVEEDNADDVEGVDAEDADDDDDGAAEEHSSKEKAWDEKALENPLSWMFSKLSYQARWAHISRRNRKVSNDAWIHQITSIFKWFAAMSTFMSTDDLAPFLNHILSPVYRIVEDDTIRDPRMPELKTLGQELQTLVQEKMDATRFSNAYNRIRQNVLSVRRDRKSARAVNVTTRPEQVARRKIQRNVAKKDSRKRKNQEFSADKVRHGLKRARFET